MNQEQINKNIDYLYGVQIDETNHQNHRMLWILAAQSLIFAALPLKDDSLKPIVDNIACVLILVGCFVSVSAVYSMMVGELTFGNILDEGGEYRKGAYLKDIQHCVIAVPNSVLKSKLKVLSLYSFAPRVFCTAWITMLFVFLHHVYRVEIFDFSIRLTALIFILILFAIMAICCMYSCYKKNEMLEKRSESASWGQIAPNK